MANIIKIPHIQNALPFSNLNDIDTYCTAQNFTYSMTNYNQWGEYIEFDTPLNFLPDSSNPSWTLLDDGTAVRLSPTQGSGTIWHFSKNVYRYRDRITCYIVAKPTATTSPANALLKLSCDTSGDAYSIDLFDWTSSQIGIRYMLNDNNPTTRYLSASDVTTKYHIFAFKGICHSSAKSDFTLNVNGTFDSFQAPNCFGFVRSMFPWRSSASLTTSWDIKLIAFLSGVAESDEVIANNIDVLRTIYNI